jgi:hypothetical protein
MDLETGMWKMPTEPWNTFFMKGKGEDLILKANELQAAVQQVRATPALLASFVEAANFITLSVTSLKQTQRKIGM